MRGLQKMSVATVVVREVPHSPHLGANVMATVVAHWALLMALVHLLQLFAFLTNVGHWMRTRTVACVIILPALPTAFNSVLEFLCQIVVFWQWALGVARLSNVSIVPALLVACQYWLQLLTILIERLPWSWASLVTSILVERITISIVAGLVTDLHTHH